MSNIKNIHEIKIGDQVTGMLLEFDGVLTERPFTWGTPWTVLSVDNSHVSEPHVYRGVAYPARTWYRVFARAAGANGFEQTIGLFGDNEGLILAEVPL